MSWILWALLAALLVLPVLLRIRVGDEPRGNEITDEQDPRDGGKRSDDAEMRAAA
jgi:hypothetical protein